ncbi:hypothetical protein VOLCADRAFT_115935 [Volvox carteri f. nagariensis]|uniref:Sfi1 spindle body domain-containing protein n=1 Tax=Volvox carteri f. nagariensis TaxID=3068 RepID=D8TJ06_VOLCA|nr:uncharacterized protein VOLCADRAFT_115935 [Volvox carteri f. nagariensis]EFJ52290.1 hypothetical protein VOLCADRAFT_115935 [Volvox carteri f. nagariensis]|eukprot:XP_002946363.1 hypothetical protein VOLCADRAFT_115935 [Volvox carteri f. nagariensis]
MLNLGMEFVDSISNPQGIRPLSKHPTSRHGPQEDKTPEPQGIRKSVSFSLRVRGPGAGYNSPSPEHQQAPTQQRCPGSNDAPQQQATLPTGPEGSNEAVVRRLFRAVQGYASSPEPQPKVYPGWIPQPQQNKIIMAPAEPALAQDSQPAANPTTAIGRSQSDSTTLKVSGQAPDPAGSKEAGLSGFSMDAHALAQARIVLGCTSPVGYPLTTFPSGPAGLAPGIHSDGWPPVFSREPVKQLTARQHSQQQLGMHGTVAGNPPAACQGLGGALPVPMPAIAGWEFRQAPSRQAGRRSISPHRVGLRSSTGSGPGRAWGQVATRTVTLGQPTQKASPRPTRTPPPTARTITQPILSPPVAAITTARATAGIVTATAMASRSPGVRRALATSPEARSTDGPLASAAGSPHATFEQVHLLLASLNLPGLGRASMGADRPPMGTGCDAPEEQQRRDLDNLAPAVSAFTAGLADQHISAAYWPQVSGQEGGLTNPAAKSMMAAARTDLGFTQGMYRRPGAVRVGADAFDEYPPQPAVAMNARCGKNGAYENFDAVRWPFDQALAARGPGGPRAHELAKSGSTDAAGFLQALQPACYAWLRSVARIAAQQRQAAVDDMGELVQQLQEAQLERKHVEAYLLGSRLGISRHRLARLHELVVASGTPPAVTAALLSQLEDRLRLKVALGALRRYAAGALHLLDLLQSRNEAGGPLAAAAWQCWRRAAATSEVLRGRMDAMAAARWRLQAVRVLSAWHTLVRRTGELRELGMRLHDRLAPRRAAQCLFAWRAACMREAVLRRALVACCAARIRRQLLAWRDTARRVAHSGRLRRTAERQYRSRLLLASLAHWRFLHVSRAVERVWDSALARRRGLQLLARAMHVWHFYARRCRQLIRQLAGRHAAVASDAMAVVNESELPAPLALAGVPIMIQQLLSAARTYMLAMSDELLHLRSFLRFTKLPAGAQQRTTEAIEAHKTCLGPGLRITAAPLGTSAGDDHERADFGGVAISRTARAGDVRCGRVRASPRLLISGQWRHKRQVLVLLAQLQQVERMAEDVDAQLEAAERDGRIVRLGLQQRADQIQRRTAASLDDMAAARAQQQALQADMEHLDKEVLAVGDYIDRCHAASVEAANELRNVEAQLAEAEARHQEAQAAAAEATAWEASLRHSQLAKQAAAEAAARQLPHPSFTHAQEAERRGRERLLAAQRRLSEALQLKAALMAHWRETQLEATAAPRYAAQRHALRVAEAQQQVVEAAKVVSLAELERSYQQTARLLCECAALCYVKGYPVVAEQVHDLLVAVDRLTRATQDAKGADDELQAAADAADAQAADAAERTVAASRETAQAAVAEQRAQGTVLALRQRLRELQEAQTIDLPSTPTMGQSVLLEPLRAREEQLKAELEACTERAEAAQEELRAAMTEAAALSQQVEAAEVSHRAQLLRLQPARAKLQQSAQQLRSKLEGYPSELGAGWDWTAKKLPLGRAQEPRPGMLLADSEPETDSDLESRAQDGGDARLGDSASAASMRLQIPPPAVNAMATLSAAVRDDAGLFVEPEHHQQQQASNAGASSSDDQLLQQPQHCPGRLGLNFHGMSTVQLSRFARAVLGSATAHNDGVVLDTSPVHRCPRSAGFTAMAAAADADDNNDDGYAASAATDDIQGEDGPPLGVIPPRLEVFTESRGQRLAESLQLLGARGAGSAAAWAPNVAHSSKPVHNRCARRQQLPSASYELHRVSKACHECGASSPPHALPHGAAISQEPGRHMSLLERALGHDQDAARLVCSNADATGASEVRGVDGEDGSAADPSAAGTESARLGAYHERQGSLLGSRHEGSSQLPSASQPYLDDSQTTSFWEMGYPRLPFRTPAISSSGGVAGSVSERRCVGSSGNMSGQEEGLEKLPSQSRKSAPASEPAGRAAGRLSSASSIHAHLSDPGNMLAQGATATSTSKPCKDANLGPMHTHELQLQDDATAAAKGRDIGAQAGSALGLAVTPCRPSHVTNGEAPIEMGGAEGSDASCSASQSVAVDAGTTTPRGLDGAAWLFNRRRLCCRTLQGFRAYATSLTSLAARLRGISGVVALRSALLSWRSAIREPKALAERVARCSAYLRCLHRWQSYVCERRQRAGLIELGRKRIWQRILRACFIWWCMWCNDQVSKRRAAAKARAHLVRGLLLRWRRGSRMSQEKRACATAANKLRCFSQWLHVLRTRQLLLRVFARAEMLWDAYPEPSTHFGNEFDALRQAFNQLRRYRAYRLDKRKHRINEQAAAAFRASLLRVRSFAAWQAAVESAREERFVIRRTVRLLRAWRLLTRGMRDVPGSLCNLRRRLRTRGYLAGEADVRRQRLLRCALAALRAHSEVSYRQYARTLLSRALSSWRLVLAETANLVKVHQSSTLRALLWQWHAMAAAHAQLRCACSALMARRHR